MSGVNGRQSSSEVAHEAEDTRAHLASTLAQLRTNLRPENVVDEVMANARAGAASVADGIAGVAKANPLPSLVIAAGVFVVMGVLSRGRGGFRESKGSTGLPRAASLPDLAASPPPDPSRLGSSMARLDPGSDDSRDHAEAGLRARVGSGIDTIGRAASAAADATTDQAIRAAQRLSHYVPRDQREVRSKLSNLLEEQPLILGAIGLAVGAAIGAALPITETEDHVMGGPSHQLRHAAAEVARHEVDGLRAVAGEAVGNIRKTAADHGLSAENFNDLVKDVGAEARAAVDKVGSAHDA